MRFQHLAAGIACLMLWSAIALGQGAPERPDREEPVQLDDLDPPAEEPKKTPPIEDDKPPPEPEPTTPPEPEEEDEEEDPAATPPIPPPTPPPAKTKPEVRFEKPKDPPATPSSPPVVRTTPVTIPPVAPPRTEPVRSPDEIERRLEARANFLRSGDAAGADVELGRLVELRETLGLMNMPLVSAALIHHSRNALHEGDLARAVAEAEAAASLSPQMVSAHWMRFHAYLAEPEGGIFKALGAATDAIFARFKGFRNQVALLTDLLGILSLTLIALGLILAFLGILKYGGCAAHDLAQKLPQWAGRGVGFGIVALVLIAPLALGLGLVPAIVLWLVLVALYQSRRERVVSLLLIALLSLLPMAIRFASPLVVFHGSIVDTLAAGSSEAFAPEAEQRLIAQLDKGGRRDFEAMFVLAIRARRMGDLEAAEKWYREALKVQSGNVAARNNLANVLYLQRKTGDALNELQLATRTRQRAEPFLNLASMQLDQSQFDEARRAIETAREINSALAARYNDLEAGITTGSKLIDVPFVESELWGRLFALDSSASRAVSSQVWHLLGGRTPAEVMLPVGFGLILMVLFIRSRRLRFSTPCPKCGMAAAENAVESYCDQCHSIFLKAVAVEPSMRLEKEHAIRRHQRRRRWTERILSLLAGAGHVFSGRALEGSILLALFIGVFAHLFWMDRLSVHAWSLGSGFGGPQVAASLLVALSLVLISVARSVNR